MIESASQLYSLLREKDNLHLRQGEGRDDGLYLHLKRQLQCPDEKGLGTWLAETNVSAQRFLQAFFAALEPLVEMYRDIYAGMKKARVRGATECARIKLQDGDLELDLDLAHFASVLSYFEKRRALNRVLLWDAHSVFNLTDVVGWLIDGWRAFRNRAGNESQPFIASIPAAPSDAEIAEALVPVREVLQELTKDRFRQSTALTVPANVVLNVLGAFNEICDRLAHPNPQWRERTNALDLLARLPFTSRPAEQERETVVQLFQHVLDLPLWKYRWYLYEVWTGFQIVRAIESYSPQIQVDQSGRIELARGRASIFARIKDENDEPYEVLAQAETPVDYEGRRGICPDYRIVRSRKMTTLALVECKQRGFFVGAALEINMRVYDAGTPFSMLNLFVNYDAGGAGAALPPRTALLVSFKPRQQGQLERFDQTLLDALSRAGVRAAQPIVVLLDNSRSMDGIYDVATHAAFWRWYEGHGSPPAYRFTHVLESEPLASEQLSRGWDALACDGRTDLATALQGVIGKYGTRVRVLVLTDLEPNHETPLDVTFWKPSTGAPEDFRARGRNTS